MKNPLRLLALVVLPLALALALAPAAPLVAINCPATNINGCKVNGSVVLGDQVCCTYTGSDCDRFERTIGPCYPT